ncbi:MAG: acyl-CoA synthetase FdrA [Anaerolineales bacterium]|nr:acyl-CoA synthetase FdrA [Anaerolineales bacterium]
MPTKTIIRTSEYHDSVSLMLVAREIVKLPGVEDAAVVMGTQANKGILEQSGLLTPEAKAASANDLVIAVEADEDALDDAIAEAVNLLDSKGAPGQTAQAAARPKSIESALEQEERANVAVISVAGRYATAEAWHALRSGLHVLLFSDNVPLEDEIELKQYARDNGLLLMGPGAGTTILNGVALGFANVLPRGPVGIVSAAGTGLQEVSTLLAKQGVGVSQGIGVGGRDLSEEVGGIMMLAGLEALQADPDTEVIVLISKPPAASVADRVLERVGASDKPTIVCFMGARPDLSEKPSANAAVTLQEAALLAADRSGVDLGDVDERLASEQAELAERASELRGHLADNQRYLRGLFSGGTLTYETQVVLNELLSEPVHSNVPLDKGNLLEDSNTSQGHTVVDLGEEEFTVGRPHPMIDNDLRIRRLQNEAQDPEVAVVMLDVVIGYGAHDDPASELGPAIEEALERAESDDRTLTFVTSVTGTEDDPQVLSKQVEALEEAGAIVLDSNAAAARLAGLIVSG